MLPGAIWGEGVPKPTGNAPRGGSIEGSPNFVWVISGDLDRFKRARVLGFIRPVVPLAGLPLYDEVAEKKLKSIFPGDKPAQKCAFGALVAAEHGNLSFSEGLMTG
jgi:hypothetical protein